VKYRHSQRRPSTHRRRLAQTARAVNDPGQEDTDGARTKEHGGKHHEAGEFWDGLAAKEMRGSHGEGPQPGERESQRKVGDCRKAGDKIFIF
jgi:hypothetical protein